MISKSRLSFNSPETSKVRKRLHEEMAHIPIVIRPHVALEPHSARKEFGVHEWRSGQEQMLGVVRYLAPLGQPQTLNGRVHHVPVDRHTLFHQQLDDVIDGRPVYEVGQHLRVSQNKHIWLMKCHP